MVRYIPLLALVLSACVATPPLVMGESAPPITFPPDEMLVQVLDYTGAPLSGASVSSATDATDEAVLTDEQGKAVVRWVEGGVDVTVDAPAHDPQTVRVEELPTGDDLGIRLSATVLDGIVTGIGGNPLPAASVTLGAETVVTDDAGRFQFVAAEAGDLLVSRPAYLDTTTPWVGSGPVSVGLDPLVVRGLYINASAMSGERWEELLDIARETEVNAFVIDIKAEGGRVFFESGVPLADEIGATRDIYDPAAIRAQLDELGIYLIGRVVAFQDPIAAQARPDMAIIDTSTGRPYEKRDQWFLDPTDPNARQYAIDLAVAACDAGIQEIQFDYVRYPDGLPENVRLDGTRSTEGRPQVIADFLATARDELHARGCAVSADIFGFITRNADDGGIGQQLEMLAEVTDALSPMIYPSHYSTGWYGFEVPNDHPGPMVANAMDDGLERIEGMTIFRPWLQDFWYEPGQVRAQIDEAAARDVGWMLWHPGSSFSTDALAPAG
jgi:hypothetical protein